MRNHAHYHHLRHSLPNRSRQQGITLVELLIAITLGIVMTYGVSEIYVNSKQTYRVQDGLSRMQDSARFALDLMSRDIRRSGYIGCSSLDAITPNVLTMTPAQSAYDMDNVLVVYNFDSGTTWTPAKPTTITTALANTDILTATGAGSCSVALTGDMASTSADITINNTNVCGFDTDDVVLVSNCSNADVFKITDYSSGTIEHATLSSSYTTAKASELMTYRSNSYYIADDVDGIPSLYVRDNSNGTSTALLSGVENMQIQIGTDSDGDGVPNVFSDATDTTGWSQVVALRITLLMRSIESLDSPAYTFTAAGNNLTLAAGPLRKEFTITVQLRNRGS